MRRMTFVQCSNTGTALSCYILPESIKTRLVSFLSSFLETNFPKQSAYFAQVEAPVLVKNETVRSFDSSVQPLVEKNWCYETASTITMKCYEIVTEGLAKTLCQKILPKEDKSNIRPLF